jgi:RND family efflux transporter MFP subunit
MSRHVVAFVACLAVSSAAPWPAACADEQSPAQSSVLVTLTPLKAGSLPRVVIGYGSVEPAAAGRQTVMAPLAAIVGEVYVRLGEEVARGAPLTRLVPSPRTASSYTDAGTALKVAQQLVASTRKLAAEHLATAQQLADAEKSESDARSALTALDALGAAGPHIVRAPFRAVVTALSASPGAIVAEGSPLLELAAPAKLVLRVGVVPAEAAAVAPNQQVAVTLVGADRPVPGRVLLRGSATESGTGLVPVEISLPPGELMPGELAEAAITTGEAQGYVVPHEAILVNDSGAPYVVQAIGTTAHKVAVSILVARGDQDVVSGQLKAGAPLVLAGNYQLDEGTKIRLVDPAQRAP